MMAAFMPNDCSSASQQKYTRYHYDYHPVSEEELRSFQSISLYQAGDIITAPGYHIGFHVQYAHEVTYIKSGRGKYFINGEWFPVSAGDIILARRGDMHDGITDNVDPMRAYYVGFDIISCESPYEALAALFTHGNVVKISNVAAKSLEPLFEGIFEELLNREEFFNNIIETYLFQLLLILFRTTRQKKLMEYTATLHTSPSAQLIDNLLHYIDNNIENIKNLNEISTIFGYSYSRLSHLFREKTGFTLYEHYDRCRFDRATELLKEGRISITEISSVLGYQSLHAFSKAFSKRFGISPKKYQQICFSDQCGDPFYAKSQALLHDENGGTDDFKGNLIFCQGLCMTRKDIPPEKEETSLTQEGTSHHAGHIF